MTLNDNPQEFNLDRFIPYLYWNDADGSYWLNRSTVSAADIQLTPSNLTPETAYQQAVATLKTLAAMEPAAPRPAFRLPGWANIIAALAGFVVTLSPVFVAMLAG